MTTFVFTSPDGKEHEVEGPEGATEAQAFEVLQQQLGISAQPEEPAPERIPASEFGGMRGIITPDEAAGVVQPTKEQQAVRAERQRYADMKAGRVPFEEMTDEDRRIAIRGPTGGLPTGVGFVTRAGMGVKVTPKGKAGYLAATKPGGQAPIASEGGVYVYDGASGEYLPVNPPGLDIGDLAELSGPAIELAPNIALAKTGVGANPLAQGAAAAGGAAVRQAASAALPGDDQLSLMQRAGDVTLAGLTATGLQYGMNRVAGLIDYARPVNVIGRKYQAAVQTPQGRAGLGLEARMKAQHGDFFLTVAEETQDPWLLGLQQSAAASFKGKGAALAAYNARARTAFKIASDIGGDDALRLSPAEFGDDVAARYKTAVDRLFNNRRAQADADFSVFKKNPAKMPYRNLVKAVEEVERDFSALRGSVQKGIRAVSPALKEGEDMLSVAQAHDLRNLLSKASFGQGRMFDRLSPQTDKIIAKQLVRALDQDFIEAAEWVGADLAGPLRIANKNWAMNTELIKGLRATSVGKVLRGKEIMLDGTLRGTENLADTLFKSSPRDLAGILKLAEFDDPVFAATLRNQFAQRFVRAGVEGASRLPVGSAPFNFKAALEKAPGTRESLKIVFPEAGQRRAYLDLLRFTHRMAQHQPNAASGLKPTQEAGEIAALVGGMATGHLASAGIFGPKFYAKWLMTDTAAKMMFSKEGQAALRTLATAKPASKAFAGAAAYAMAAMIDEPSESEVATELEGLPPQ